MKAFLKRSKDVRGKSTTTDETPYLDARRAWNIHTGTALAQQRWWQLLAMVSLLVALAAVGGVIHIGSQSKFIPYVVEVDKLGQVRAAAPVARASTVDPRVVRSQVARFVDNLRAVSPDVSMQRKAIFQVYSMLEADSAAATKVDAFYVSPAGNPRIRAARETVAIQIESVLAQTGDTWEVDWVEHVYGRDGKPTHQPVLMRALLTVEQIPPNEAVDEKQVRENPLGIYVKDFNWSKHI